MTRLLSDICYFGIADVIPNPSATGGPISKAIATSSIISCRPSTGLTSLPDDILLIVVSLIGVEDILALRMVCTHDLDSTQSETEISILFTDIKALYLSHKAALGMVRCPQIPCHRQEIARASIHRRSQISLRQGTGSASDTCFQIPQKLVLPSSTVQEKCRFPHQRTDYRGQLFNPTFQRSPTPHFPGPFPVRSQWRTPYHGGTKSCRLLGDSFRGLRSFPRCRALPFPTA